MMVVRPDDPRDKRAPSLTSHRDAAEVGLLTVTSGVFVRRGRKDLYSGRNFGTDYKRKHSTYSQSYQLEDMDFTAILLAIIGQHMDMPISVPS